MSDIKEPSKVTKFKEKAYKANTHTIKGKIVNRIDEAVEAGYRVEYLVDGMYYK